ncbi:MAG: endolytic transglycosylase MltG [Demequina sp.]
MSTAREELATIQHRGAAAYAGTPLASGHGRVTRRVRRDRAVRAGVASLAGVGLIGAGTFGALQLRGPDALAPMGTPSPSSSSAESPTPSRTLPEGGVIEVEPGERADAIVERLADAYDVDIETAREAVVFALPPEAGGEPEGWLAAGAHATWAEFGTATRGTLTQQASSLSRGTEEVFLMNGVPRAQWQDLVTVASLVEQETRRPEDMPRVARVLLNRLDAGMRLELDSTVRYALGDDGDESPFTTAEDRNVDSAYNTYTNPGLPPGPIATPSREAIEAAISPADGEWMFFVTVNPDTGEARFAEDFEQHQENVLLLQEWAQENG